MTSVQIAGIAAATAAVLLLIIVLLLARHRRANRDAPPETPRGSFLDDAPQDTFANLGRAEQPVEDITVDPGAHRDMWSDPEPARVDLQVPLEVVLEHPTTGADNESGAPPGLGWGPPAGAAGRMVEPAVVEPAQPSETPDAGSHRVPLSDIIVTTSTKLVDLHDPEVRRMLTDLVKFEIDQATHYRLEGQTIDAVLQLTEAEKISRALDMRESAAAIHKMMEDLRGLA